MWPNIRWSWSAPGRSGCRSRSIWRSAARAWCCSTTPTGSARARARSAFPSARWNIWDRLGVGQRMVDKGVVWSVGKIFHGASLALSVQSAAGAGPQAARLHQPAAILCRSLSGGSRRRSLPAIDLRWRNKVIGLEQRNDHVVLTIETPDGPYRMHATYVVACDGARSSLRQMVGAEFAGQGVRGSVPDRRRQDDARNFRPSAGSGSIRRFTPDVRRCCTSSRTISGGSICSSIRMRIPRSRSGPRMCGRGSRACSGHDKFEFEWISLYKFQCRRMEKFIHGRVIFAGDAAHQVSPFGARGANSGLEDAENLAWKLDRVLRKTSPEALLESYHSRAQRGGRREHPRIDPLDRFHGAGSRQEARLRKAVLSLAKETEFGKRMINGGRLSVPSVYDSPLSTADGEPWRGGPRPGASMLDAPIAATRRRSRRI